MTFIARSLSDLMLLAYATGVQDAMPTVSDERACERFLKKFGHEVEPMTIEAARARLVRQRAAFNTEKDAG